MCLVILVLIQLFWSCEKWSIT